MSVLQILTGGDPILRRVAGPADVRDPHIAKLAIDMLDTLMEHKGMGLAAPQVGQSVRLIVMRTSPGDSCPRAFVNPRIIKRKGEQLSLGEGCLSVPGKFGRVKRAAVVWIEYEDLADGVWIEYEDLADGHFKVEKLKGIMAVCAQHEIDHLDGVLFIDKLEGK